ncbi:hypothetical protein ABH926_004257 [Catenulispora sp. GP43]|uniref:hypothetical protein n=1 Tax=Catenulispora sp. GP43 TaxID=3156263 RepID=UPI00351535F8
MNNRLRTHHVITAALILGLAGCSSAASTTAQNATTPASTAASTASSAPDTAATTSADVAASTTSSAAAPASTAAGSPARPADACTMLSSDQVAAAVGTPGPYNESHEDPADDGSPVWGCSWGTQASNADFREVPASTFQTTPDPADITTTPVSGIGDKARMDTMTPDGRNPELQFTIGGAYYELSVTVDRSETGASNAGQEESAERELAKLLVAKLTS